MVVGADGNVEARPLKVTRTIGSDWLVDSGLRAGDRVIVEGLQRARPGMTVQPVEADEPERFRHSGLDRCGRGTDLESGPGARKVAALLTGQARHPAGTLACRTSSSIDRSLRGSLRW